MTICECKIGCSGRVRRDPPLPGQSAVMRTSDDHMPCCNRCSTRSFLSLRCFLVLGRRLPPHARTCCISSLFLARLDLCSSPGQEEFVRLVHGRFRFCRHTGCQLSPGSRNSGRRTSSSVLGHQGLNGLLLGTVSCCILSSKGKKAL